MAINKLSRFVSTVPHKQAGQNVSYVLLNTLQTLYRGSTITTAHPAAPMRSPDARSHDYAPTCASWESRRSIALHRRFGKYAGAPTCRGS